MEFYIVIVGDYEGESVVNVLTDKIKAEKCKEYQLKMISLLDKEYGEYGRHTKIVSMPNSDNVDFDALIYNLDELEKKKIYEIEEEIKAKDFAEFNRIKKKYNL